MKLNYCILSIIVFMLVSSCATFPLKILKTTIPPDDIVTTQNITTPVELNSVTVQSPKSTTTPALSITSTIMVPENPGEIVQTPTLTFTEEIVLTPKATQALFSTQIGSPIGIQNFAYPDLACQWAGLAGQIFDKDNLPINDLVVEIGGNLGGKPIFGIAVTGVSTVYGPGGYEIKLGDEPVASNDTVWVQLFDLEGNPISSPIYFSTYGECKKNLILLNFVHSSKLPSAQAYLPVVYSLAPYP